MNLILVGKLQVVFATYVILKTLQGPGCLQTPGLFLQAT
jgi:hypothetical protein